MTTGRVRWSVTGVAFFCAWLCIGLFEALEAQGPAASPPSISTTTVSTMTQLLGRPTDNSITLSVLAPTDLASFVEYGIKSGEYTRKTAVAKSKAGTPIEILIEKLKANTHYYYRLRYRQPGSAVFTTGIPYSFQTRRPFGSTFVFGVQGDSHPERLNKQYDPEMYARTLSSARDESPDFYIALGDDFSIDTLTTLDAEVVKQLYINQRTFFGRLASSAPLFPVPVGWNAK
jgi:hypothetical protein